MAKIIEFTISIEEYDESNYAVTTHDAKTLLVGLEDYLASRGYSIHDQNVEEIEA